MDDDEFLPFAMDGERHLRQDVTTLLETFAQDGDCAAFLSSLPLVHTSVACVGPRATLARTKCSLNALGKQLD